MEEIQHIISGALDNLASNSSIVEYDLETGAETVVIQDNNDRGLAWAEALALQEEQEFNSTIESLEKAFPLIPVIPAKAGTQSNQCPAQRVELIFFLDQLKTTKEYHCVESLVGLGPGLRRDDGSVVEIKITDFAWAHAMVSTIYSVFHAFNDLLKEYDPFSNFPFPTVNASPGSAARASAPANLYRSSSASGSSSYSAAGNNRFQAQNHNRPQFERGNSGQTNSFQAPNSWSPTPPYRTASIHESREAFLNGVGNNNYGASAFGPTVVPLLSIPIITATFATDKLFSSSPSPILSSSPSPLFSSTPSPLMHSDPGLAASKLFQPPPKVESFNFEAFKVPAFEPSSIPISFYPTPAFPEMSPVMPGIHSDELGRLQAQYEAEQRAKEQAMKPFPPDGWVLGPGYILLDTKLWQQNKAYQRENEQAKKSFPPKGWVLGPNYIVLDPRLWQQNKEQYNSESKEEAGEVQPELDLDLDQGAELGPEVNGMRLLTFATPNPEAKRQYAEMQAQAAKEISAELKRIYSIFSANNIWVDISYIANILTLPIESIISLLENDLFADMLLEKARIIPANERTAPTSASSGGGNDCDDPAAQAEFDKLPTTLKGSEGGKHKGHAYRKHIGQTFERFQKRFTNEPDRDELSSFFDTAAAEKAYSEILNQAKKAICDWLTQNGKVKRFEVSSDTDLGHGLKRGETATSPRRSAEFVFTKTQYGPRIITAFPI